MMKNAFYFMFKALFVLEISTFLYRILGYVEKRLDKKFMIIFKIYYVTDLITNVITYFPVFDVINFEINHNFFMKPFFYITKIQDKNFDISRTKRAFNMK